MQNQIFGKGDIDPGRWKPFFYAVDISVGVSSGKRGTGVVVLNSQPFVLKRITHTILGQVDGVDEFRNDGQYLIRFTDDKSIYQNIPIHAGAAFGGTMTHYQNDLPYPLPYSGRKNITFEVTNLYNRVFGLVSLFNVQIQLHGVADWGELTQSKGQ